jgi:glycosyltransferase involved in cell wall biosynthesis
MRILRVFPTFQDKLLYGEHYIAKELKNEGIYTTFLTSDKYLNVWKKYGINEDPSGKYKREDFDIIRINSWFPMEKALFKNPIKIIKYCFYSNFDHLHLYGMGNFNTILILWMSIFFKSKTSKILISDHTDNRTHLRSGFFANLYHGFFRLNYFFLQNKVNKYIVFSEVGKNVLTLRYGIKLLKFQIIPLGYDSTKFSVNSNFKNTTHKFNIGFAGKITKSKKIDFLMNVIEKLPFKSQISLNIVGLLEGDDYCGELMNLASKLNYEINFYPIANAIELAKFYNKMDILVFPGGISITTIEASGCGTSVIIYKSLPNLDERVSFERGKLFETEKELIESIDLYFQNPINELERKRIASITEGLYSWKNVVKKYKSLFIENGK